MPPEMPPSPTSKRNAPRRVLLSDVTLREHGQNVSLHELKRFTPSVRAEVALALVEAGFRRLEILSCVSPKVAPAMAPELIYEVAHAVGRHEHVDLVTLVPNTRGLETFYSKGLGPSGLGHKVGLFFSAVESHNQANLKKCIGQTKDSLQRLVDTLQSKDTAFVAYVSAAFGYHPSPQAPVDVVPPEQLIRHVSWWFELGAETVTVSDLQGLAGPTDTAATLETLSKALPAHQRNRLGYHPHHRDPETGLTLVARALEVGLSLFDSSLSALGGCVTGAPGNVPTQGVVSLMTKSGVDPGVDAEGVRHAQALLGEALPVLSGHARSEQGGERWR